ncbi:MAG: hypothetical protein P4L81_01815 [Candidatus Pacebacteria bacterium]|nr:hypothetical protein [Candidatus Paceibacterota bacterium]
MDAIALEFTHHPFAVRFRPCVREPEAWKKELQTIATSIVNEAGSRPIIVCSSGGIDSEVICRILFDLGIHFSVLTVAHAAGTNERDIWYAKNWCQAHAVTQKIVTVDMEDFFQHRIETYVQEGYVAGNVFRYFQLFLLETVENMGGYAVLGGGEQLYHLADSEPAEAADTYIKFDSGFTAPLHWMQRHKTTHRPYFYYSMSEAVLAYLQIPIIDFAVRHPELFRHHSNKHLLKQLVINYHWPDILSRIKLNGYELIANRRAQVQAALTDRFGAGLETFALGVEEMREQLRPSSKIILG